MRFLCLPSNVTELSKIYACFFERSIRSEKSAFEMFSFHSFEEKPLNLGMCDFLKIVVRSVILFSYYQIFKKSVFIVTLKDQFGILHTFQ